MAKEQKLKFKIVNLQVKDKSVLWTMKIKALNGIAESKKFCKVEILVDDDYFSNKIDAIQRKINERENNPDLFDASTKAIKGFENDIKTVENERNLAEELEMQEFETSALIADYDKGTLQINIPEGKIEELIKIRQNVSAYSVNLK